MKRYAFAKSLIAVALLGVAFSTVGFTQVAPTTPAGVNTPAVVFVSTDPSGTCTMNNLGYAPVFITVNTNTGLISRCTSGSWVNSGTIIPSPGVGTAGTAANPFASLFVGTAATNNVNIVGQAQAAARTINIPDYGLTTQQFPGTVFQTSAYTNATTTLSNVTGLSFPVAANTNYTAHCELVWQGSATTTGPKWAFTGPSSPTQVWVGAWSTVTGTTMSTGTANAFATAVANAGTITATTNFIDIVTLNLLNGANAGTVQLQAAANGAGTLTVQTGSWCRAQ